MTEESLYSVFGLPPQSSPDEVRAAYRHSFPQWESALSDPEKFKKFSGAFAAIADPSFRALYDEDPAAATEKFDLTLDLALKGYDEEMIEEYLRRLSFEEGLIRKLVAALNLVRSVFVGKVPVAEPEGGFRKVSASQGMKWIAEGFSIFKKSPLMWVVLCVLVMGLGVVLSAIPVLGELAFYFIFPLLFAGLMQGCRSLEEGGGLEFSHLLQGFQKDAVPLISIGGIYLFGQMLVLLIMVALGGDVISKMFIQKGEIDPVVLANAADDRVMLGLFAGMILSVPLMMLVWFAPMLVMFKKMTAKMAMRQSFFACVGNTRPFLIFGAMIMGLTFIALLPFGLGLLLLVPVVFASIYASYKDIFEGPAHIDIEIG